MSTSPFTVDVEAVLALPEPDRTNKLAQVARLKQEVEGNRLWSYLPHEGTFAKKGYGDKGQVEYHEINRAGTFIGAAVAGNRFGKSHVALVDNLIQILPPEFVPPWLEPYRRRPYAGDYLCRSVVVDLPNALTKTWLPKLRKLVPPGALFKGDFSKAWNDRYRLLTFADGSWWDFLTHDMDVDAFAGSDLDRVHFDEEPPGEKGKLQFDESLVRVTDRDGDIRLTMTPLLGYSWVYYELTTDGQVRKDDEVWVVTGGMDDNPHTSDTHKKRLRKRWEKKEPLKLKARLDGEWVHFEGLIYDEFREAPPPDGHVITDRPIPRGPLVEDGVLPRPTVPIYCAIDPGINHPAALVFAWIDSQDVMEVFYAEKFTGAIVADLAKHYHGVCERENFRPRWTVIDPAARSRNFETGRNVQQVLSEHGIHTLPGQNARIAGFDRVKERLRSQRLLVHEGCEGLIDEFRTYRWKRKRTQSEDEGPQEPIKTNDDLLDALRYICMSMPVSAAPDDRREPRTLEQAAFESQLKRLATRNRRVRVGSYVG